MGGTWTEARPTNDAQDRRESLQHGEPGLGNDVRRHTMDLNRRPGNGEHLPSLNNLTSASNLVVEQRTMAIAHVSVTIAVRYQS